MAENKKSFLLYCDYIHMVDKLPNEKAGELFKHILSYVNDLNPKSGDILIDIAFEPIKQQLKRDLKKYELKAEKNKENGQKGGRPRNPKKPTGFLENPSEAKKADTDNDTDTVTDNDTVNDTGKDTVRFNFKNSLIEYGFEKSLIDDWLLVRKNKKATNSETAFNGFISELEKRSCNLNETLKLMIEKSWAGFKWEWVDKINNSDNGKQTTKTGKSVDIDKLNQFTDAMFKNQQATGSG